MGLAFERVVIVMLENSTLSNVLNNAYMNALRSKGAFLSNSSGATHPSQPNYIATVGGDTLGVIDDSTSYVRWVNYPQGWEQVPPVTSIVDLLEAKSYTWRSYAEDLPAHYKNDLNKDVNAINQYINTYTNECLNTCPPYKFLIPPDEGNFARRHVPFLAFPNIISVPKRLARIVDASQFEIDLAEGNLPNYSWYTPNLINNGHSLTPEQQQNDPNADSPLTPQHPINIDNIANFLQGFLGDDPVAKFPPKTLIVITFDEAYPYYEPYGIYTLLIGDMVEAGSTRTEPYNHYSLLHTIEDNFDLGTLQRNDQTATPYWFVRN